MSNATTGTGGKAKAKKLTEAQVAALRDLIENPASTFWKSAATIRALEAAGLIERTTDRYRVGGLMSGDYVPTVAARAFAVAK